MKVGTRKGVIRVDLKKIMAGGGGSRQPEKKPGYATVYTKPSTIETAEKLLMYQQRTSVPWDS